MVFNQYLYNMGLGARLLPNYTYDDYRHWEGRWEVIDGVAIAMSPAPSFKHQRIANELGRMLSHALDKSGCSDCTVYQPVDVLIKQNIIVRPDLLIICGEVSGSYLERPPALVVEILSTSTRFKDQTVKRELYQDFGIPYYIMIDPEDDSNVVLHLLDGKYVDYKDTILELPDGCKMELDFGVIS